MISQAEKPNESAAPALPCPTLLTEAEAAARLRLTVVQLKRLRLTGRIPYIPGRPPRLDEADLAPFIAREKVTRTKPEKPVPNDAEIIALARARIIKNATRRRERGL